MTNMGRLLDIDDFVAKLWNVHLAVQKEGYAQVCFPCPMRMFLTDQSSG